MARLLNDPWASWLWVSLTVPAAFEPQLNAILEPSFAFAATMMITTFCLYGWFRQRVLSEGQRWTYRLRLLCVAVSFLVIPAFIARHSGWRAMLLFLAKCFGMLILCLLIAGTIQVALNDFG